MFYLFIYLYFVCIVYLSTVKKHEPVFEGNVFTKEAKNK